MDMSRVTRENVEHFYQEYQKHWSHSGVPQILGVGATNMAKSFHDAGEIEALIDELNYRFFNSKRNRKLFVNAVDRTFKLSAGTRSKNGQRRNKK